MRILLHLLKRNIMRDMNSPTASTHKGIQNRFGEFLYRMIGWLSFCERYSLRSKKRPHRSRNDIWRKVTQAQLLDGRDWHLLWHQMLYHHGEFDPCWWWADLVWMGEHDHFRFHTMNSSMPLSKQNVGHVLPLATVLCHLLKKIDRAPLVCLCSSWSHIIFCLWTPPNLPYLFFKNVGYVCV